MTNRTRLFALVSLVALLLVALAAYWVFRNIQAQRLFANRQSCVLLADRYAKRRDGMNPHLGLLMYNSVEKSDYSADDIDIRRV